jgi:hypothetical protein
MADMEVSYLLCDMPAGNLEAKLRVTVLPTKLLKKPTFSASTSRVDMGNH